MTDLPREMIEAGIAALSAATMDGLPALTWPHSRVGKIYLAMRPHDQLFRQLVEAAQKVREHCVAAPDEFEEYIVAAEALDDALLAAQEAGVTKP